MQPKKHLSSFQIIAFGFFVMILLGTLLLMLPISTSSQGGASFSDALFTATSAVCVTGLVVRDTATYWSGFGHGIILMLIQIGGLGVVTMTIAVSMFSGKKIGLKQRSTLQEAISVPHVGGIIRLTGFILKTTLILEGLGAICLAPVFIQEFGFLKGLWYSLFHSVSAFCNAGFDLMGIKEPFSSLTSYFTHPVVNIVIMILIILGGIGFLVWNDIYTNKWHWKRYRMQTKVVLTTSLCLILLPALYYFFYEFSRPAWDNLSVGSKIWMTLFQSVAPRTAGFNTMDMSQFTETGIVLQIFLMLIGGSPGSTAGGMKTTTVAVLFFSVIAMCRRKEDTCCFGRSIAADIVRHAATILVLYLGLFLIGSCALNLLENQPMLTCMFETASAIGTVGSTLGITTSLSTASRIILIVLMFFGRTGGLTLIFAAVSDQSSSFAKLPKEHITVG